MTESDVQAFHMGVPLETAGSPEYGGLADNKPFQQYCACAKVMLRIMISESNCEC